MALWPWVTTDAEAVNTMSDRYRAGAATSCRTLRGFNVRHSDSYAADALGAARLAVGYAATHRGEWLRAAVPSQGQRE